MLNQQLNCKPKTHLKTICDSDLQPIEIERKIIKTANMG